MRPLVEIRAWDTQEERMWYDVLKEMSEHNMYSDDLDMWTIAYEWSEGNKDFGLIPMMHTGVKQVVNADDGRGEHRGVYAGDIVNIHIFYPGHDPNTLGVTEEEKTFEKVEIKHGNPYGLDVGVDTFYFEHKDEIINLGELQLHEESFEVLGNIYQNPELLQGSE